MMLGQALEKAVAGVVARWLLDGGADAVLAKVAATQALPPEELEALRAEAFVRLERVRAEGAPYIQVMGEVAGALWQQGRSTAAGSGVAQAATAVGPLLAAVLRAATARAEAPPAAVQEPDDRPSTPAAAQPPVAEPSP